MGHLGHDARGKCCRLGGGWRPLPGLGIDTTASRQTDAGTIHASRAGYSTSRFTRSRDMIFVDTEISVYRQTSPLTTDRNLFRRHTRSPPSPSATKPPFRSRSRGTATAHPSRQYTPGEGSLPTPGPRPEPRPTHPRRPAPSLSSRSVLFPRREQKKDAHPELDPTTPPPNPRWIAQNAATTPETPPTPCIAPDRTLNPENGAVSPTPTPTPTPLRPQPTAPPLRPLAPTHRPNTSPKCRPTLESSVG